jgi:hypothetical protein
MPFKRAHILAAAILAAGMLSLLSIPIRADWLLWLDGPGMRSNSHDPKSPYFKALISRTPTLTAQASPTHSPTFSASPSFTASPTPTITPLVYYDAEVAGASIAAGNREISQYWASGQGSGLYAETSAGGPHGGSYYLSLSMAAVDSTILEGIGNTSGSCNVTSYNALSIWLRSPDACFPPLIMLHSPSQDMSAMVTFTAYTAAGAMLVDQWQQAIIPLSAFNGPNINGVDYNLAAEGNLIDALVLVAPFDSYVVDQNPADWSYGYPTFPPDAISAGAYGSVDMDDVVFVNTAAGGLRAFPAGFEPFTNGNGITAWNTQWQAWCDTSSCMSPVSSIVFPGTDGSGNLLAPVDSPPSITGDTMVACYAGHISGVLGAANGLTPCSATDLSLAYMIAGFDPSGAAVDLASQLGFTPQGVSFYMAQGPNTSGVDVDLTLVKQAVQSTPDGPYADYFHRVTASQLAGGNWVHVTVPFPASGVDGTDCVNSFGQPSFAAANGDSVAWGSGDLLGIRIGPDPDARGLPFDIYIDDITFY